MIVIAIVPALVSFIGALVYFLASNPKVSDLGRLAFFAGLLALMFAMSARVVRIG